MGMTTLTSHTQRQQIIQRLFAPRKRVRSGATSRHQSPARERRHLPHRISPGSLAQCKSYDAARPATLHNSRRPICCLVTGISGLEDRPSSVNRETFRAVITVFLSFFQKCRHSATPEGCCYVLSDAQRSPSKFHGNATMDAAEDEAQWAN